MMALMKNDKEEAMGNDAYFTARELADYLRLNVQTVYRKTKEGGTYRLPHTRIDGSIRFKKSDVDKWLNENSIKGG